LLGSQVWRQLAGGALQTSPHFGICLCYGWYTTNVTVEFVANRTVPIIDIFQQEYGQMIVPEVNITYLFDESNTPADLSDDVIVLKERIVPKFQLIKIKTQMFPVTVVQTSTTTVSLGAKYNFTGQYTKQQTGHEVLISDAKDYIFGWYGIENASLDFKQSGGFTIDGELEWNLTREITFDDGTPVNESVRMPWWRSSNMTFKGIWSHSFEEDGTITGKGALQNIVQAIRTRASTNVSEQLLIWANLIPSTMFGYFDSDNSGDASVRLNGSVLEIMDEIMALGLVQGFRLENAYNASNFVNAISYWKFGDDVLTDQNIAKNKKVELVIDQVWGADPTSENFTDTSTDFSWIDPSVDSNGNVTFNWGIDYSNFPVTWHVTNGTTEILNHIEKMNIGYDYTLIIDPNNGEASLSNTYSNSGLTNSTIKSMVNGLHFATYKHDLFLGMQKAEDEADGTESTSEETLSTDMSGVQVIDQVFGGSKQGYTLGNSSSIYYDSQVTVVNVLAATGTSGEPESVNVTTYSPFATSGFARRVGLNLLKWSADNRTTNSDWEFRENIVITAYPVWDGQSINHDPTYSAFYAVSKPSGPDTTDTDTTQTGTTSSDITDTSDVDKTSSEETTTPVNWELLSSLFGLFMIVVVLNQRRKR
jgi:hypothetical protein